MELKIALAGNPNSGKTTLFNALTGSNQFVGNWPGVTVEKKEGKLKGHKDVVIEDCGILVQLTSVEEFAKAILSFYKSPEKCETISKNNLELCKKFDINSVKTLLFSIIEG